MISGVSNSPYRYQPMGAASSAITAAPAAPSLVPQSVVPVQAGGGLDASSILGGIQHFFQSIASFFVGLWGKITHKTQQPTAQPVDADTQKLASQYNLLPTKANVDAFVAEVQSYSQPGPNGYQMLGPGSSDTQAITQIQQALKSWGYPANVTGQYDAATQQAVKAFKKDNGLHQNYQMSDGSWAINEYLDYQTAQAMQKKASGGSATPANPTPPATSGGTSNGTVNWQAIATQYKLYSSQDNVNAFLAEVKTYQTKDANGFQPLGPGSTDSASITQVQNALSKVGFQVAASGQWDATTQQAIMSFKTKYGIHQSYRGADGNWAVNEYADAQTLQKLSQLVS